MDTFGECNAISVEDSCGPRSKLAGNGILEGTPMKPDRIVIGSVLLLSVGLGSNFEYCNGTVGMALLSRFRGHR
jgi:hypothetical protein